MAQKIFEGKKRFGAQYQNLRSNPDRGLRMEVYYTLGTGEAAPGSGKDGYAFLEEQAALYKEDDCHAAQVYIYLREYEKEPLTVEAMEELERYLQTVSDKGFRIVLRFAYEFDMDRKRGPSNRILRRHAAQLGQWMRDHEAFVYRTVMVLQAGMVGAWGEWHSAKHRHSPKKTLPAIYEMALPDLAVQVRTMLLKNAGRKSPYSTKVGFHDDFLVGTYHEWNVVSQGEESRDYQVFLEESRHTLNDAEMPWGSQNDFQDGYIDGKGMMKDAWLHHLSTLSLTHNYKENGGAYNMERWKKEFVTEEETAELGCPAAPGYFLTPEGDAFPRSVYDYLQDHLGYLIGVNRLCADGESVSLELCNFGMAIPANFSLLQLCLLDQHGQETVYTVPDYTPDHLQPMSPRLYSFPASGEIQRIGIRLQNAHCEALCIQLCNGGEFHKGTNYFYPAGSR